MKTKRIIYLLLAITINLFIWIQSLLPAQISSEQSGFFTTFIHNFLVMIKINISKDNLSFFVRKLAHFTEFFLLGLLWFLFFLEIEIYAPGVKTIYYGLIVAMTDELIQNLVVGRSMETRDVFIDGFGVLTVVIFMKLVIFTKEKKNQFTREWPYF